jgi:hypothetical protein
MCLSTFLSILLVERDIDSRRLRIVPDNAKLEAETRKVITLRKEGKRCRWSLDGKVDSFPFSDPCLTKPMRREEMAGRSSRPSSIGGRVCSESSLLRIPAAQRSRSIHNHDGNGTHNATWDRFHGLAGSAPLVTLSSFRFGHPTFDNVSMALPQKRSTSLIVSHGRNDATSMVKKPQRRTSLINQTSGSTALPEHSILLERDRRKSESLTMPERKNSSSPKIPRMVNVGPVVPQRKDTWDEASEIIGQASELAKDSIEFLDEPASLRCSPPTTYLLSRECSSNPWTKHDL